MECYQYYCSHLHFTLLHSIDGNLCIHYISFQIYPDDGIPVIRIKKRRSNKQELEGTAVDQAKTDPPELLQDDQNGQQTNVNTQRYFEEIEGQFIKDIIIKNQPYIYVW